jgi:hypothetical protein
MRLNGSQVVRIGRVSKANFHSMLQPLLKHNEGGFAYQLRFLRKLGHARRDSYAVIEIFVRLLPVVLILRRGVWMRGRGEYGVDHLSVVQ